MRLSPSRSTFPAAVAAALALTGLGFGQFDRPPDPFRPLGPAVPDRTTPRHDAEDQRVRGEVVRSKLVDLRGSDQRELVVLLRTDGGEEHIVDLGPSKRLKNLRIRTGDEISAHGRRRQVGRHTVFMATRVTAAGETVAINRPAGRDRGDRPKGGSAIADQSRRIQGVVEDFRTVTLRGSDRRHLVARVRSSVGQYVAVDLGPPAPLRELGLERGDRIVVQGRDILTDGREVVLAYRLTVGDETVAIDRSPGRGGVVPAGGTSRSPATGSDRRPARDDERPAVGSGRTRRAVEVVAKNMAFYPSQVVAAPGETLTVRLVNNGNDRHSIKFELPDGEVALDQAVAPGEERTVTVTAPRRPGKYRFYCPVGDHRMYGMTGTLVVREQE